MNLNKSTMSAIFLILGMICLFIGVSVDNALFSYAAVVFVLISLVLGGRWMRRRKK